MPLSFSSVASQVELACKWGGGGGGGGGEGAVALPDPPAYGPEI